MTYKVFQWASGGVGAHTTRAAIERSSLELIGMHVHTDTKVGMDAGELIGMDPVGVAATSDIEVIKASDADVVIHTPLPSLVAGEKEDQDLDDFCELLSSGKNVITVVGYMYPKVYGEAVVNRLEDACRQGNVSFHSTGLNPGWMGDLLPMYLSALCERVDLIHVQEVSRFDGFPSAEIMFDSMGFNATPDE
ncbi:MAG: dihydrodipicolinate reductase, partial [Gammaproteobacteria bacterium]|nr:dihydrodipicolinate reductase [Gammaproteobacteria bacterium]